MSGNSMSEMFENADVRSHIINELRKRVRPDRPAESIRELNILRLEEQIEDGELRLEGLRAELNFIRNLDVSVLK